MSRVAVVDHGAGNLVSIARALESLGGQVVLARRPADLEGAQGLVVPGVGASAPAMRRLARASLDRALADAIGAGLPYLGICLGLQLLFDGSDEDGAGGLGLLRGRVRRLDGAPRLPHMGWNAVERTREHALFAGIDRDAPFYFVHSFAGEPTDPGVVLATTEHGRRFASAVAAGNVLGVQFHPERSGRDGLALLANFLGLLAGGRARPAAVAGAA
ncbi:MAG: imidazole glycerol phosphate synthase, glutamine amidotransferase subunit [Chloroflexi bacterium GWC2_73_18]|nr:MAG: imidazole glycerol phosphate synthase, glutamine amidotransferase subunit [Chloroflexi bacterium GWC2_73_18]